MRYSFPLQNLMDFFKKFPTVGPKTAERFVFYLLKRSPEELQALAQAIAELKEKVTVCRECLSYSEKSPCPICSDKSRDHKKICVVSNTRDMISVESTGEFKGVYHVLGGLIDTVNGIGPESLNIKPLLEKTKNKGAEEVLLALDPNIEGETTSMYLAKLLKGQRMKVTRLARGLSTGIDLEYADENTLANALKYRNEL